MDNWKQIAIFFILVVIFVLIVKPDHFSKTGLAIKTPDAVNNRIHGEFYRKQIEQGVYPLWNPYKFSGMPTVIDGILFLPQGTSALPLWALLIVAIWVTVWQDNRRKKGLSTVIFYEKSDPIIIGFLTFILFDVLDCALRLLAMLIFKKVFPV